MFRTRTLTLIFGVVALAGTGLVDGAMATTHGASQGLILPDFDAAAGRQLFASKGCVVCHSVNGVGGEDAPPLDASNMQLPMNAFDFAANMWRGADAMIFLQREELGEQIELNGDELADIIAFVHDEEEQAKFSLEDVPPRISELMGHIVDESEEHEEEEHGSE